MTGREHTARGASRGVLLYGLVAAGSVVLFLESWRELAARWMEWSLGYDHGWLIAALSAWLVWRERDVLAVGRPCWPGLVLVAGAAMAWLVARAADVGIGQQLLLPVLLWSAALTVLGPVAARALAFPIGFLYFAVPVWDVLNPFLQAATTAAAGVLLDLTDISALIEGNDVTIPAGRFVIATGCAGQAFFMTAGALAALYGHLHYGRHTGRKLLLLAVAFAGAMVLNWVRVYIVILAGHLTDMQHYLVRVDHYNFGWALFAVGLVPFFLLARRLGPAGEAGAPVPVGPPAAGRTGRIAAAVAVLAVMALAPLAWQRAANLSTGDRPLPALPDVAGWQKGPATPSWRPAYVGADAEFGARFRKDAAEVDLWVVSYATQAQGKELVYYANHIAQPGDWRVEATRQATGSEPARDTVLVDRAGDRRLVRWWYDVGGRRSASDVTAKLHQVLARLAGRPEAALIAFSAACAGDCDAATTTLDEFEHDMAAPPHAVPGSVQQGNPQ